MPDRSSHPLRVLSAFHISLDRLPPIFATQDSRSASNDNSVAEVVMPCQRRSTR